MDTDSAFNTQLRELCERAAKEENPQRMIVLAKQIVDLYYSRRSADRTQRDERDVSDR